MIDDFEAHRPLLFGIAYRMLGSVMEAEDMVQETFLRYQATPPESIRSPKNFLCTVVTRLCLNELNTARSRRETYIGPWLPEPMLTDSASYGPGPADSMSQHESISMAFMVLLENLSPVERAVFLLREVFDYDYSEIAPIVDRSVDACRQTFSRARKHVDAHRPRFDTTSEAHRELLWRFIQAVEIGEMDGIMHFLAEDVTLWTDGGGKAYGAATRPVYGREHAALFILGSTRFLPTNFRLVVREINGQPGIVVVAGDQALGVLSVDFGGHTLSTIRFIGNPEKLRHL